ncbi:MAG: phenylalanine--tRNA ligase subunit alpha [Patescibacteria group bacterium]
MTTQQMNFDRYAERIRSAKNAEELAGVEHEIFGRKQGVLTLALKELSGASPEVLREKGRALNEAKKMLSDAVVTRRTQLTQSQLGALSENDPLDITLDLPKRERGHLHLIPEFIRSIEEVFGRMGFDTAEGPEIETEDFNFNFLNIPETHAARDSQDTFNVHMDHEPKETGDRLVLRTHTSPVQIRYMLDRKPPFRMICPGKVYRKDSDATHSPVFHQFEGLMIGQDVSLANLKAVLITALTELIGKQVEFRFRTGFFPFVKPGLEMDMMWQGALEESREGRWLEMGGCGMVHPNVLKNVGIDPKKWQGFAFGFGVERSLMIKHQIPDLRSFYDGDLRFLRQF